MPPLELIAQGGRGGGIFGYRVTLKVGGGGGKKYDNKNSTDFFPRKISECLANPATLYTDLMP